MKAGFWHLICSYYTGEDGGTLMGKMEGLITMALLVVIFVMVAGCSHNSGDGTALPGADSESFNPGVNDTQLDPDSGVITPVKGFTFDLIKAASWVEPEVEPGSTHYFSFDPCDVGGGALVTWTTDGGYFISESGEYVTTLISETGDLVGWIAPSVSGPSTVGADATGPQGEDDAEMVINVEVGADGRTSQPFYASLIIDDGFGGEMEVAAGELLVSFGKQTDIRRRSAAFNALEVEPLSLVDIDTATYRIRVASNDDLVEARDEVSSHPEVAFAEYNYIYHLSDHVAPNDYYWSSKWDLTRMNILDAWDIEEGTNDVIVAVIDTGVDLDHPDLVNRIMNGADFVSGGDGLGGEVDGDGSDNNFNGWTDENVGHGTHCAGIIGAESYNGIGSVGVNINVTILPLRVFPVDGDGGASVSSISAAMSYARSHGASVISLSLGGPYYSSTFANVVQAVIDDGVSVVCAAGNSSTDTIYYPAGYPGAIAVASIDSSDSVSYFSNYGDWIDICAPGSSIRSTYYNDTYCLMSGTSMACPEVAGVVALIRAYKPLFSETEVREALMNGADDSVYDSNPGFIGELGSGCVDALGSLEYCDQAGGLWLTKEDDGWIDAVRDPGRPMGVPAGD